MSTARAASERPLRTRALERVTPTDRSASMLRRVNPQARDDCPGVTSSASAVNASLLIVFFSHGVIVTTCLAQHITSLAFNQHVARLSAVTGTDHSLGF